MITKVFTNRIKKDLLRLAVFSLITVFIWLGFVTYRTLNRSQIKPEVKKQLTPLTASLELDTMEKVTERLKTPPIDWDSLAGTAPVLILPKAELFTKEASGSAGGGEIINDKNNF